MKTKHPTNRKRKPMPPRRTLPARSPAARQRVPDVRPFVVTGRDAAGKVIALDRACDNGKASQVAESWRGICATVEITDTTAEPSTSGAAA